MVSNYKKNLSDGILTNIPACHLQFLEQPDLTNILVDVETCCKEVEAGLTNEDIVALARPQALLPLQQEFLHCQNRLYHMPNHWLIQLDKERLIPHRLAGLNYKPPICASCCFGRTHKRPWQKKGKHTNPIQSKDDVNPGDCVSKDQIVSAQPVLVPQMSGYLISDQFWGITLFLDHATEYTYCHLIRSLDLDEILGARKYF